MDIVAISDTHFPFDTEKGLIPDGDVLIHAGDLLYRGNQTEWDECSASFSKLTHATKLFVPGNHDRHVRRFPGDARRDLSRRGVKMLDCTGRYVTYELPNGMVVLGLPFVTGLPNWAFNEAEEYLEELVEKLPKAHIVVSHSPPYGIGDGENWGVRAWNIYQEIHRPEIWINGHVHECYGIYTENGTTYFNVAMCDRGYNQVNPGMMIDV